MILRVFYTLLLLALLAVLVWVSGLFWFVNQIPDTPNPHADKADAIIVLTGGAGRVEHGLKLLSDGRGDKLFVSGVSRGVKVHELIAAAGMKAHFTHAGERSRIVLGFKASDTRGNALETAEWMTQEKYTSMRLVTGNYHLPRSIMEIRRLLPQATIIADPVFPENFKRGEWWKFPGTTKLILSEYHKYVLTALEYLFHFR